MQDSVSSNQTATTTIIIDDINNTLTRDGVAQKVDPLIFKLLSYLSDNSERVITRQQLMENVWKSPYTSDTAINRSISELRKALGGPRNSIIKTLSKKGYTFALPDDIEIKHKNAINNDSNNITTTGSDIATISDSTVINAQNNTKILKITAISMLVLFILILIFFPSPKTQNQVQQSTPIGIYIEPITFIHSEKITPTIEQSIQDQMTNTIVQLQDINLAKQLNQDHNQFTLKSKISEIENELNVNLQLIDNNTHQFRYSTVIKLPLKDIKQTITQLTAEIRAILILSLQQPIISNKYIHALNPLSHDDIYQLVNVSNIMDKNITNGGVFALNILTKLNNQYPNTAEILGLLSRLIVRVNSTEPYIEHKKRLQFEYAQQALALDPKNFDAMISLFYYQIEQAHLREQATRTASDLIRFHGDSPKAWRAHLYQLVRSAAPCSEIETYTHTIPTGVFKPKRLEVINHILQSCLRQQPLTFLLQQANAQPNDRLTKAIYNNYLLFDIDSDEIIDVLNKRSRIYLTNQLLLERIKINLIADNITGANTSIDLLTTNNSTYWQDLITLYKSVYRDTDSDSLYKLDNIPYAYLNNEFELMLISYLHKITKTGQSPSTILNEYLTKRPQFTINIENRKETIAMLMAQYLNGDITQSQAMANQLFEILEQYRQQQPKSFNFWSLGRYHLIAKAYCGQNCNTIPDEQYLSTVFSSHHTWWLDDLTFMQIALSPWQNQPLIQSYLKAISDDKTRFKNTLGL